jgi:DNA repair protein RecO (recombination protein O)
MNQIVTTGIMLSRTNFGEADRIITILTPDQGKLKLMARGVRRVKSKLAGGVELFSVSNITYIKGKKDIGTLVSTRLQTHFSHIVEDIDRTMIGYDIIKLLNKATEDAADVEYYRLLLQSLTVLNADHVDPILTKCWFMARLLQLLGHSPNVSSRTDNGPLNTDRLYGFDYAAMGFYEQNNGIFTPNHIKVLRLLIKEDPQRIAVIKDVIGVLKPIEGLLSRAISSYTR